MEALCNNVRDTAIATYGGTRSDYRTVLVGAFIGNSSDGEGPLRRDARIRGIVGRAQRPMAQPENSTQCERGEF